MSKALVLFSAGQDSATCLAWALTRYYQVETIGFDYGQRHRVELDQRPILRAALGAWRGADRLGEDAVVDLRGYGALAESALTADRAIAMAECGLPTTFVPGRNLVFLAVAAAHAYRRGADTLVAGMCETDYSGYPDCRAETIAAMQAALRLGLDRPALRIETPLMRLSKADTWALAHALGGDALVALIEESSHTCYAGDRTRRHDWGYGCGACPACDLRAKGWRAWRAKRA
ncbi:MAG: 7-cyano-7-deazaguanine synthase QueC [Hydrogenophilaceae bacterium]|jgi:7-cyano-7-deazaguanine synthase|nr:7-cyano-7-deazaguanine synthase QueC [Hydrogenophilaceae bacterium]